jgi:hypothetical protein
VVLELSDSKIGGVMPQSAVADRRGKLRYDSKTGLTRKRESVVNADRML